MVSALCGCGGSYRGVGVFGEAVWVGWGCVGVAAAVRAAGLGSVGGCVIGWRVTCGGRVGLRTTICVSVERLTRTGRGIGVCGVWVSWWPGHAAVVSVGASDASGSALPAAARGLWGLSGLVGERSRLRSGGCVVLGRFCCGVGVVAQQRLWGVVLGGDR